MARRCQYFADFKFTNVGDRQLKIKVGQNKFRNVAVLKETLDLSLSDHNVLAVLYPKFQKIKHVLQILPEFEGTLDKISQETGEELDMEKRELFLVASDELKPKTKEEAKKLINKYGRYILKRSGGDCKKLEDGNYILRVSISEHVQKASVLENAAHEYGHTLGKTLDSTIFEELKAFAFASLFQRFYEDTNESKYKSAELFDVHRKDPHEIAKHRLGQLLKTGIPEEAVLSHLTGKKFGRFSPEDYLKFISNN